ncbi:hypothetical protein H5410_040745 [Solanum commersonii]|uniref:Uncharacterized protein n=1 Tax=Solanum commersonii TaxID=4109 RepID=A0A9J5XRR8_SOLCO|nr:hypothetical protein H5410_040745 [Solanum commersonii]
MNKKLFRERHISLEKIEETLLTFHKGCLHPVGYSLPLNLESQMINGARLSTMGQRQSFKYMVYSIMISIPSRINIVSRVLG